MFKIYYFKLEFAAFLACSKMLSIQTGSLVSKYSLLINLLMFCRRATLLSVNFYTTWGTNTSKFIFGILNISYKTFNAISATLKFASPKSFMRMGSKFFMTTSSSNSDLFIWNFVWSSSIASNLTFQSLSFFKSYSIFFPIICSSFSCLVFCEKLEMGGKRTLDSLRKLFSSLSWRTDRRLREYCSYFPEFTPVIDSTLRIELRSSPLSFDLSVLLFWKLSYCSYLAEIFSFPRYFYNF